LSWNFCGQKTGKFDVELLWLQTTTPHHNHFTALSPGPPGWAGARRELLDFMVQGKINRGRHTDHLAGRHSIWTKQCPPPPLPHIFYGPDALPATQQTVSKNWTQFDYNEQTGKWKSCTVDNKIERSGIHCLRGKSIWSVVWNLCAVWASLISERELMFTFTICYRLSVCRLSVICNVCAPYSGGSNFPQYF